MACARGRDSGGAEFSFTNALDGKEVLCTESMIKVSYNKSFNDQPRNFFERLANPFRPREGIEILPLPSCGFDAPSYLSSETPCVMIAMVPRYKKPVARLLPPPDLLIHSHTNPPPHISSNLPSASNVDYNFKSQTLRESSQNTLNTPVHNHVVQSSEKNPVSSVDESISECTENVESISKIVSNRQNKRKRQLDDTSVDTACPVIKRRYYPHPKHDTTENVLPSLLIKTRKKIKSTLPSDNNIPKAKGRKRRKGGHSFHERDAVDEMLGTPDNFVDTVKIPHKTKRITNSSDSDYVSLSNDSKSRDFPDSPDNNVNYNIDVSLDDNVLPAVPKKRRGRPPLNKPKAVKVKGLPRGRPRKKVDVKIDASVPLENKKEEQTVNPLRRSTRNSRLRSKSEITPRVISMRLQEKEIAVSVRMQQTQITPFEDPIDAQLAMLEKPSDYHNCSQATKPLIPASQSLNTSSSSQIHLTSYDSENSAPIKKRVRHLQAYLDSEKIVTTNTFFDKTNILSANNNKYQQRRANDGVVSAKFDIEEIKQFTKNGGAAMAEIVSVLEFGESNHSNENHMGVIKEFMTVVGYPEGVENTDCNQVNSSLKVDRTMISTAPTQDNKKRSLRLGLSRKIAKEDLVKNLDSDFLRDYESDILKMDTITVEIQSEDVDIDDGSEENITIDQLDHAAILNGKVLKVVLEKLFLLSQQRNLANNYELDCTNIEILENETDIGADEDGKVVSNETNDPSEHESAKLDHATDQVESKSPEDEESPIHLKTNSEHEKNGYVETCSPDDVQLNISVGDPIENHSNNNISPGDNEPQSLLESPTPASDENKHLSEIEEPTESLESKSSQKHSTQHEKNILRKDELDECSHKEKVKVDSDLKEKAKNDSEHKVTNIKDNDHEEKAKIDSDHKEEAKIDSDHKEKAKNDIDHKKKSKNDSDHKGKAKNESDHKGKTKIDSDHKEKIKNDSYHKEKAKIDSDHKGRAKIVSDHEEKAKIDSDHKGKAEIVSDHEDKAKNDTDHKEKAKIDSDHKGKAKIGSDHEEKSKNDTDHKEKAKNESDHKEKINGHAVKLHGKRQKQTNEEKPKVKTINEKKAKKSYQKNPKHNGSLERKKKSSYSKPSPSSRTSKNRVVVKKSTSQLKHKPTVEKNVKNKNTNDNQRHSSGDARNSIYHTIPKPAPPTPIDNLSKQIVNTFNMFSGLERPQRKEAKRTHTTISRSVKTKPLSCKKLSIPDHAKKQLPEKSKTIKKTETVLNKLKRIEELGDGWKREFRTRINGASAGRSDISYYPPCGKRLRTKNDISVYLAKTGSPFTLEDITSRCDQSVNASKKHCQDSLLPSTSHKKENDTEDIMYVDPNLPPGWKRKIIKNGHAEGKKRVKVHLISADGTKLTSFKKLEQYLKVKKLAFNASHFNLLPSGKKTVAANDKKGANSKNKSHDVKLIKKSVVILNQISQKDVSKKKQKDVQISRNGGKNDLTKDAIKSKDDWFQFYRQIQDKNKQIQLKKHKIARNQLSLNDAARAVMLATGLSNNRLGRRVSQRPDKIKLLSTNEDKIGNALPCSWIQKFINARPELVEFDKTAIESVTTATEVFIKNMLIQAMPDGVENNLHYYNIADLVNNCSSLEPLRQLIPHPSSLREARKLAHPPRYCSFTL